MATDFRLLGSLEVVERDRPLVLGGVKQRSLLAILLLNANEVISTERLIDELWGGTPPATVAKSIHTYVARLRRQLGDGRLVTRAPGYLVRVAPEELDVARFERLVAEADGPDPARTAATLREALALWRGPALADLALEPFAQRAIERLEELRIGAVERRIDADLACGRHADLIGELGALVRDHPLRERLHAQLMLALYRCGRQAEALEAFRSARNLFVEEIGVEPSPRLRQLHQAILEQAPVLDPAPVEEATPQTSGQVFVGRRHELAALLAGLDDAFAGRGRLFLIDGEPGIGKSRLAEELSTRAFDRGARVLAGRCWEQGGAPAYWPWTQALRGYMRSADASLLRAELGVKAGELTTLMPELRERFPDLPEPTGLDPEGARFRLFDATVEFLRSAAERRPLVLVLDDLHAADEPTLLLLQFVTRALGTTRITVVGGYRTVDPLPHERLTQALAELAREPVTRRLSLTGLRAVEVAEYVEATASRLATRRLTASLHERTQGNPLFVGEIVRLLAVESADEPDLKTPQSIRDVIARRVAHLSPDTNRLLALASVLGREFAAEVLADLADVSHDELIEQLDEAIAARVLAGIPGSRDRLRFEHVLIRDTLYDGLTTGQRLHLHKAAAAALERRDDLGELARHTFAAGDPEMGLRYARQAAVRATQLFAYDEAARLYRFALDVLDSQARVGHAERIDLLLALGDALAKAGDTGEARATFVRAGDLARNARLRERLARAALGYGGAAAWQRAGRDTRLVALLQEALNAIGTEDSRLRAQLLARLAGALRDQPSLEPRASLSREAVAIARRLGDDDTLAYTLAAQFMATWGPDVDELAAIAAEVNRIAERTTTPQTRLDALTLTGIVAWLTFADAETEDHAYDALAQELRQSAAHWQGAMQNAHWALFRGEFSEAEHLEQQALRSGGARSSDADCSYRLALFVLRRPQGRLADVEALIRDAVDRYPGYRAFRCFIPTLEYELGRKDAARRAFAALAERDFAALPRDSEWLFCLSLLAETAAHLRDRDAASVLYQLLGPYARVNAMAAGEVAIGPVARYLGILATALGRWSEAEMQFRDAIALSAGMGARPWLAHTREDLARMLLARDETGDSERAHELLAAALRDYRELGMTGAARAAVPILARG